MGNRKYICQNVPYFQYGTNDTIYEVVLSYTTAKGKVAEHLYDAYVEDGVLYVEKIKIDGLNEFLNENSRLFSMRKKKVCFSTNSFSVTVID